MENSKSLFFCKIRKATKKSVLELPILVLADGGALSTGGSSS